MSTENSSNVEDSLIFLDGEVSPIVLASILGFNISYLYQEAQKGAFPVAGNIASLEKKTAFAGISYRQALRHYIDYHRKGAEAKIAKVEADRLLKEEKLRLDNEFKKKKAFQGVSSDESEGIHPLTAMKLKQDIRLARAKEEQLLQKNAIERGEFIQGEELIALLQPFLITIRSELMSIVADFPETQDKIDKSMESLYKIGTMLIEQAESDQLHIVAELMDREIDVND